MMSILTTHTQQFAYRLANEDDELVVDSTSDARR